jgi:hypothetical protein
VRQIKAGRPTAKSTAQTKIPLGSSIHPPAPLPLHVSFVVISHNEIRKKPFSRLYRSFQSATLLKTCSLSGSRKCTEHVDCHHRRDVTCRWLIAARFHGLKLLIEPCSRRHNINDLIIKLRHQILNLSRGGGGGGLNGNKLPLVLTNRALKSHYKRFHPRSPPTPRRFIY